MNDWTTTFAPIVGRILVGGFFLWSGIEKTLNFTGFVGFFASAGYPQPVAFAIGVLVIEVLGGLALIVDLYTRPFALLLALYVLVSATLSFGAVNATQVQLFLQSMAILGGLLLVVALGRGRYSRDWQSK